VNQQTTKFKIKKQDSVIVIAALVSVIFYVIVMHIKAGSAGFPLDDSWIHQTYGRNLALTGLWEYVPGNTNSGSTAPLYTLLLALGYFLRLPFFAYTYALGAVTLAAAGLAGSRLAENLGAVVAPKVKQIGLWTGLAIVFSWHLVWAAASGMETILFCALAFALTLAAWREGEFNPPDKVPNQRAIVLRGVVFGVIGAALIATRPEGIILIGLLVVGIIIAKPQASVSGLIMWCGGALVGGLIALIPYLTLNLRLSGLLVPNTFAAKQAEFAPLLSRTLFQKLESLLSPMLANGEILLFPAIIWTIFRLVKNIKLRKAALYLVFPLWLVVHITVYVLRLPIGYQHGRYMIPILLPLIIFGVVGIVAVYSESRRRGMINRLITQVWAFTTIMLFVVLFGVGAFAFGEDVRVITTDMVVASKWVQEHVPADNLIATHDIGAIGYFAPHPLFDLAGLISPEVIPIILDGNAKMQMMEAKGAKYLVVLNYQSPTTPHDPRLCERFNARGGMGGMIVYQLAWDGKCIP
jgi:hypothetical protein